MEGRNPGTARAAELLRSRLHFAGGLVGKGDGENIVVRDSRAQQVGYAMGDDTGLAAARPGKDHQRSIDVGYRFSLGRIELGQEVVESCFFHRFSSDHRGVRVRPNLLKITLFQWSGKQKPQRDRSRADSPSRTHYRHLCPGENPLVEKISGWPSEFSQVLTKQYLGTNLVRLTKVADRGFGAFFFSPV